MPKEREPGWFEVLNEQLAALCQIYNLSAREFQTVEQARSILRQIREIAREHAGWAYETDGERR